ncbi:hypothetical protein KM043_010077 [Ampulex compressa]|nr:hypothetical protein KM043_010077 [Ampulex compressa]
MAMQDVWKYLRVVYFGSWEENFARLGLKKDERECIVLVEYKDRIGDSGPKLKEELRSGDSPTGGRRTELVKRLLDAGVSHEDVSAPDQGLGYRRYGTPA